MNPFPKDPRRVAAAERLRDAAEQTMVTHHVSHIDFTTLNPDDMAAFVASEMPEWAAENLRWREAALREMERVLASGKIEATDDEESAARVMAATSIVGSIMRWEDIRFLQRQFSPEAAARGSLAMTRKLTPDMDPSSIIEHERKCLAALRNEVMS